MQYVGLARRPWISVVFLYGVLLFYCRWVMFLSQVAVIGAQFRGPQGSQLFWYYPVLIFVQSYVCVIFHQLDGAFLVLILRTSRVPCTKVLSQSTSGFGFFTPFDRSRRARQTCDVSFFLISQHRKSYKPSKNGAICAWAYLLCAQRFYLQR